MPRVPRPIPRDGPSMTQWILRGFGVLTLIGLVGLGGLYAMWGTNLPSVSDLDVLEFSGKTRVYDRTGELVGTLTPTLSSGTSVNTDLLQTSDISPDLLKAVVTNEDRRFFEHKGIDFIGLFRGLIKGILQNYLEGGSSITQQLVNNTLLSELEKARTLERKFKEGILAYRVDRSFTKEQILTAYMNIVYWGDGGRYQIVGANMAARAYFKKQASQLNLAESAYLATIIPAPNKRNKKFVEYRPLMRSLLNRMVEDGKITKAQAERAWRTPIYPAGWRISWRADGTVNWARLENKSRLQSNLDATQPRNKNTYKFRSYLQAVEKELIPKIGRKALYAGGKIFTGMDVHAQRSAEAASKRAQIPSGATLGIALVDPNTGEALALVGQKLTGRRPNEWNNAIQARRQVGSSIKPLLYTLAMQQGWKQSDTVLDAPIQGEYQPKNYNGRWSGQYKTMRYSLDHSLNLTTVRTAQEVGVNRFADKLREMGLTPPANAGLSLSIGTLEASPLQMAAAYAPFVNGGLFHEPTTVRRFENKNGESLYTKPVRPGRQVWDPQTAWIGLDMIRGVVDDLSAAQGGLATRARIPGWDVGGKTGTTNDVKDLWFVGVTPLVSGAVWVGKEQGGALKRWHTSGKIPTPIWQNAVSATLTKRPKAKFQKPQGIAYKVVRRVNMAFRQDQISDTPVARDGSGNRGGLFRGRRPIEAPSQGGVDNTPTPIPISVPESMPEDIPAETIPEPIIQPPVEPVGSPTTPIPPPSTIPTPVNPNPVPVEPVQPPAVVPVPTPRPVPQPPQSQPIPTPPMPVEPVDPSPPTSDPVPPTENLPPIPEPIDIPEPEIPAEQPELLEPPPLPEIPPTTP